MGIPTISLATFPSSAKNRRPDLQGPKLSGFGSAGGNRSAVRNYHFALDRHFCIVLFIIAVGSGRFPQRHADESPAFRRDNRCLAASIRPRLRPRGAVFPLAGLGLKRGFGILLRLQPTCCTAVVGSSKKHPLTYRHFLTDNLADRRPSWSLECHEAREVAGCNTHFRDGRFTHGSRRSFRDSLPHVCSENRNPSQRRHARDDHR